MFSMSQSLRITAGLFLTAIGMLAFVLVANPVSIAVGAGYAGSESVVNETRPVRLASSPPNTALNFDGMDDLVDVGDISVLNGVSQYTIEAWVKFERFTEWDTVYVKRVANEDRAALLQVYDDSGHIAITVDDGYFYTESPLTVNRWYHTAVVYDGTQTNSVNRLNLFIDGSPVALVALYGPDRVPATTSTTASRFVLGAEYSGTEPIDSDSEVIAFFKGWIDELRIWNLPRTQAQIQADMARELTGSESGLEIYYNFSDGTPCGDNTSLTALGDAAGAAQNGAFWHFMLRGIYSNYCDLSLVKWLYMPLMVRGGE